MTIHMPLSMWAPGAMAGTVAKLLPKSIDQHPQLRAEVEARVLEELRAVIGAGEVFEPPAGIPLEQYVRRAVVPFVEKALARVMALAIEAAALEHLNRKLEAGTP